MAPGFPPPPPPPCHHPAFFLFSQLTLHHHHPCTSPFSFLSHSSVFFFQIFTVSMGIQKFVQERNGKEIRESAVEKRSKVKKNHRRQKKQVSRIQKLFEVCRDVFRSPGSVPHKEDIDRVRSVIDSLKGEDVGLTLDYLESLGRKKLEGHPTITYLHIYECDHFSIGIWCLPPSGVIPLHNHPGMTVFSKLLLGSMHIKAYDWITTTTTSDAPDTQPAATNGSSVKSRDDGARKAKVVVDSEFTAPCKASILYPEAGGNMHRFTGVTACAVLDVLGPPYSEPDHRHCTYYSDSSPVGIHGPYPPVPASNQSVDDVVWLKELDEPEELRVVGEEYMGPKIKE